MPQYAYYNSATAAPSPVLGWYDTDAIDYPSLPASSDLLAVSAAEWSARLSNPSGWAVESGALVSYTTPTPVPTLAQQAAALIAGGIAITSTGTPALNGTYATNAAAQANMLGVVSYINANGKFPGSSGTVTWYDMAGQPHVFSTVAEFMALYTAGLDFVMDCQLVADAGTGTLPVASATIP